MVQVPLAGLPQSRATLGASSGTYGNRLEEPRFHRQTHLTGISCQQNVDDFIYFAVALSGSILLSASQTHSATLPDAIRWPKSSLTINTIVNQRPILFSVSVRLVRGCTLHV
jgi:hypothetical protein